MSTWVGRLARDRAFVLLPLRLEKNLEVADDGDSLWCIARAASKELVRKLRGCADEFFELQNETRLVPIGARLAVQTLPTLDWQKLIDWFLPETPTLALPAELPSQVGLRVVRGGPVRPANLLISARPDWVRYARRAPLIRLRQWSFAVDSDRALIRGTPLPPIPGEPFVEDQGIAVQCGCTWSPEVPAEVLARMLHLSAGELVLFHEDATYDRIPASSFTLATRTAIRECAGGRS